MAVYKIADICFEITPHTYSFAALLFDWKTDTQPASVQVPCFPAETESADTLRFVAGVLNEQYGGIYLHAAAVLFEGKAYLFCAPSGTGKSTHIALWKTLLGQQVTVLNGDKPMLRKTEKGVTVYGTPWRGKEGWGCNACAPLACIYLLHRGAQNDIYDLPHRKALPALLNATLYPKSLPDRIKLIDFIEHLLYNIPVRELYCTPDTGAVECVLADIKRRGWYETQKRFLPDSL